MLSKSDNDKVECVRSQQDYLKIVLLQYLLAMITFPREMGTIRLHLQFQQPDKMTHGLGIDRKLRESRSMGQELSNV